MKKLLPFTALFITSITNAQETPLTVIEAESATLTPPVKVKRVNGYSGNAYVGDFDSGSQIKLSHVMADHDGPYEFRVYYTSMHIRSVNITANSYPAVEVTMPQTTEDWNRPPCGMMLTYIWLDKGDNTIIITPGNGGGPNIDKLELWETGVAMPRPQQPASVFPYDLSDDAAKISMGNSDLTVSPLNDNAITTIQPVDGADSYISYELDQPYLITGYLFSEGLDASQHGKDWILEYSNDGKIYTRLTPSETTAFGSSNLYRITRQPHADRSRAARYYRVNTRGRSVAEIQLFGIPYADSSNNRNFPADITDGLDIKSMVNGNPMGEIEFADERCYNLFDRNMQTKFYTDDARTATIEIELDKPMALEHYTLTSCQDYPDRDPRSWSLDGFDRRWETLSEVNGFEFPSRYATMKFNGNPAKLYRGFRLNVTENNGADRFQLLKWQLFGSETAGVDNVAAGTQPTIAITSSGTTLSLESASPGNYAICRADGATVAQGHLTADAATRLSLPSGIYIVSCRNASSSISKKIALR